MMNVLMALCMEAHPGVGLPSLREHLAKVGGEMAENLKLRTWWRRESEVELMEQTWGTTPDAIAAQQALMAKTGQPEGPIKK